MRNKLQINDIHQGMGVSGYQNEDVTVNANELWDLGFRKVRAGGTSPQYGALSNPAVITPADIIVYKAKGFYVEKGCSHIAGVDATLTSSNWTNYHNYALALAQLWYAHGLDTFMVGNEMINHVDGTTFTNDDLYSGLVALAEAIHAVCPDMKIVYNGTGNEVSPWNTWIGTHGAIPEYMQLGFNIYGGSGQGDDNAFQTQVDSIVAINGYVSEWNIWYIWNYGTHWTTIPADQNLQAQYVAQRLKILKASGLDHYFFVWKFQNVNVPGNWNDYSVKYDLGTPQYPALRWKNRKLYHSLIPSRVSPVNSTLKSLSFDGSTSYATCPIIPSGAGISLAFWYNRLSYVLAEANIITNSDPSAGYLNSFRLYHDAGSRNIVLNTHGEVSDNGYNAINSLNAAIWVHIAITITPQAGGALLYINGVLMGNALSGFIGNPTQNLYIGARPPDLYGKMKANIRNLAIQNTGTAWTRQQILDHMNSNVVPTGASWYDFTDSGDDQSNNGNDLTLVNTSTSYDVPDEPLTPRSAAVTRSAYVQRSAI